MNDRSFGLGALAVLVATLAFACATAVGDAEPPPLATLVSTRGHRT